VTGLPKTEGSRAAVSLEGGKPCHADWAASGVSMEWFQSRLKPLF